MPHLIVEYSSNLNECMDIGVMLSDLHDSADATGLFQEATIRTRAIPCTHFVVGVGAPEDAFIHLQARIRPGRPESEQWRLAMSLMAVLKSKLPDFKAHGLRLGLTVEVTMIPPVRVLFITLDPSGKVLSLPGPETGD